MAVWQGYQFVTWCWICLVLTVPFLICRLYIQLTLRHRPYREFLTLIAFFSLLGYCVDQSLENHWGDNNFNINLDSMTDAQLTPLSKASYTDVWVYKTCLYACKAVLLLLYGDLTPKSSRGIWYAIYFTWACIVVGWVGQIITNLAQCRPFSQNWAYSNLCNYNGTIMLVTYSWHFFTDILVYVIPFFILRHLKLMHWREKWGAYFMFGLGFINMGIALILLLCRIPGNALYNGLADWGLEVFVLPLQLNTAIIIVCAPQVRKVWTVWREARKGKRDLEEGRGGSGESGSTAVVGGKEKGGDTEVVIEKQVEIEYRVSESAGSSTVGSTARASEVSNGSGSRI